MSGGDSMAIIPTTGLNNCGGRCRLLVHSENGVITKITGDPSYPDLAPCVKGLHYAETYLSPQRLTTPLLRVGKRGEGKFVPISWVEAVQRITDQWIRIRDTYGPASRYVNYAWGISGCLSGTSLAKRLLRLDGGHLDYYNSYSTACCAYTTPYLYGTAESGSSYETLLDSSLILLWGHNPAETRFDNLMYYLRKARAKGIPMIVVDPRHNATAKALNAEWIPLRPSTDAALMDGMAYVIWSEGLYDREFVEQHCQGFTRDTMPAGVDPQECYFDYLAGTLDGTPKTPQWASQITGVPVETIRSLSRRFATAKPAALLQGYGGQRHANGEQFTRGGIMLACLTGNVGISGGWGSGAGYCHATFLDPKLPKVKNPISAEIPCYAWTRALEAPETMTPQEGLHGAERLPSGIKMLLNLAGNALINQHGDINHTKALLSDESKCEFILCSDLFLTPSAKFADILLPGVSLLECENLTSPWGQGNFLGFCNQVVEPIGESRFEYDWLKEVAANLGLYNAFTQGHDDYREWLQVVYADLRKQQPQLPEYEAFKKKGICRYHTPPIVGFQDLRFPTPSGRVEIYSPALAAMHDARIPPIPGYVPAKEGPGGDPRYPLQLIGWHAINRCHSIHDNNQSLQDRYPQRLWMHPKDAEPRDLSTDDLAEVWNDRGRVLLPVRVTEDVTPGTVALAQGAWYAPSADGTDRRGSVNVLTSLETTPLAHGNGQHTNLVEVRKAVSDTLS